MIIPNCRICKEETKWRKVMREKVEEIGTGLHQEAISLRYSAPVLVPVRPNIRHQFRDRMFGFKFEVIFATRISGLPNFCPSNFFTMIFSQYFFSPQFFLSQLFFTLKLPQDVPMSNCPHERYAGINTSQPSPPI